MSIAAVWSREFVVDGSAFYVHGSASWFEAFLFFTPVSATETWVQTFITHFPSKPGLAAKDLGLGWLCVTFGWGLIGIFACFAMCTCDSPQVGGFQGGHGKVELLFGVVRAPCTNTPKVH